jgi:hypothetical protein
MYDALGLTSNTAKKKKVNQEEFHNIFTWSVDSGTYALPTEAEL